MVTVADFEETDWPAIWPILREAFADGESYPCPTDMSEADARGYWLAGAAGLATPAPRLVRVARDADGAAIATYYVRPDQGGLGDHVCNCGYIVAPAARGRGLATALCRQSQDDARAAGYRGMKFNLVVATNEPAVRAWKRAGLAVIGTTPKAFRSKRRGLVDAYIMYTAL
ncbi:MAG: GNAT family N-acetyltransferase [Pseudomonadota bacterium]